METVVTEDAIARAVNDPPTTTRAYFRGECLKRFAIFLTLRKLGGGWTPPKSFIFAIIRNKVNDFLRQKYRDKNGIEEIKKYLNDQASQKEEVVAKINCLTHCEFQVFRLLGLGMTNTELAQSLHVSPETIKSHIKKIHAKCGVRDRGKLTLMAYQACFRAFSGAPFQISDNLSTESDCCDPSSEPKMTHGKIPPEGDSSVPVFGELL